MFEFKKKIIRGLLAAVVLSAVALMILFRVSSKEPAVRMTLSSEEKTEVPEEETEEPRGFVYLTGAVEREGVFLFTPGMRLFEVVEAAGGLKAEADRERVNLAEVLSDGDHVRIPFQGEADAVTEEERDAVVNLNRAGKEELLSLPGIGDAKAEAILAYRKKNGPFRSVEDLLNVPGIGSGILERIREFVKI